jgi:hypothetical protein
VIVRARQQVWEKNGILGMSSIISGTSGPLADSNFPRMSTLCWISRHFALLPTLAEGTWIGKVCSIFFLMVELPI